MSEIEKEMVERGAEVLLRGFAGMDMTFPEDGDAKICADIAREFLAAIREPTEAMRDAGYDAADQDWDVTIAISTPGRIWRAMIDEALK